MNRYTLLRQIGRGGEGTVWLVRDNCVSAGDSLVQASGDEAQSPTSSEKGTLPSTGSDAESSRRSSDHCRLLVLKKIYLSNRKRETLREADILRQLHHPHVLRYIDSFLDESEQHLCIVTEYCEGGTLEELIRNAAEDNEYLPETDIVEIFIQIVLALHYIHSQRILHRDLKTANIFLTAHKIVKIGDFGIAAKLEHSLDMKHTCVGSPYYMSPEVCQDTPYNAKSDVWALGCVLYEMCALGHAFKGTNLLSVVNKICNCSYEPIPSHYSQEMRDLVGSMLQPQPSDRPSVKNLVFHPLFRSALPKYIENKENQFKKMQHSPQPKRRSVADSSQSSSAKSDADVTRQHHDSILDDSLTRQQASMAASPPHAGATTVSAGRAVVSATGLRGEGALQPLLDDTLVIKGTGATVGSQKPSSATSGLRPGTQRRPRRSRAQQRRKHSRQGSREQLGALQSSRQQTGQIGSDAPTSSEPARQLSRTSSTSPSKLPPLSAQSPSPGRSNSTAHLMRRSSDSFLDVGTQPSHTHRSRSASPRTGDKTSSGRATSPQHVKEGVRPTSSKRSAASSTSTHGQSKQSSRRQRQSRAPPPTKHGESGARSSSRPGTGTSAPLSSAKRPTSGRSGPTRPKTKTTAKRKTGVKTKSKRPGRKRCGAPLPGQTPDDNDVSTRAQVTETRPCGTRADIIDQVPNLTQENVEGEQSGAALDTSSAQCAEQTEEYYLQEDFESEEQDDESEADDDEDQASTEGDSNQLSSIQFHSNDHASDRNSLALANAVVSPAMHHLYPPATSSPTVSVVDEEFASERSDIWSDSLDEDDSSSPRFSGAVAVREGDPADTPEADLLEVMSLARVALESRAEDYPDDEEDFADSDQEEFVSLREQVRRHCINELGESLFHRVCSALEEADNAETCQSQLMQDEGMQQVTMDDAIQLVREYLLLTSRDTSAVAP